MPTRGRPLQPLVLTDEERTTLERWARRPKNPQSLALRSRIVLACATPGIANQTVAAALGVHPVSVGKWRSRFLTKRLDGLVDEPRPGAPRTVTDEHVEAVIVKTLQETPADATHWSTRSMARAAGMSQSAVSRIWRAFGLKPHLVDTFKLSADPLFVDKVRDVVGLYMNPPDHAVVLCVDEKTQVQALNRTQPIFPMLPGVPQRQSHDYQRNGTIDLYAALNLATGAITHQLTPQHRAVEFKKFLTLIDRSVPLGPRRPRRDRQRLDAQDTGDPQVVPRPSPLSRALHTDELVVAESRGTVVLRDHREVDSTRHPSQREGARRVHHRMGHHLERASPSLRLAQDRRRDTRFARRISAADW